MHHQVNELIGKDSVLTGVANLVSRPAMMGDGVLVCLIYLNGKEIRLPCRALIFSAKGVIFLRITVASCSTDKMKRI
jgi:hypothetical protein